MPVQTISCSFLGLVNAGVPFTNTGAGTWIVLAAILVGRLGNSVVYSLGWPLTASSDDSPWRDLTVVGVAA